MTPEQQIRAVFPDAVCVPEKVTGGIRYVVRPDKNTANPIGIGRTEQAAWIAAVDKVKVEVRG